MSDPFLGSLCLGIFNTTDTGTETYVMGGKHDFINSPEAWLQNKREGDKIAPRLWRIHDKGLNSIDCPQTFQQTFQLQRFLL